MNAWYGMYLLGQSMDDPNVRDLGMTLLMTELHSAKRYWHAHSENTVYADLPSFSANKVVGILWGTKMDYSTWFGSNPEYIHCIQMLPITPISEDLLEEAWVQEEYPVLVEQMSQEVSPVRRNSCILLSFGMMGLLADTCDADCAFARRGLTWSTRITPLSTKRKRGRRRKR